MIKVDLKIHAKPGILYELQVWAADAQSVVHPVISRGGEQFFRWDTVGGTVLEINCKDVVALESGIVNKELANVAGAEA